MNSSKLDQCLNCGHPVKVINGQLDGFLVMGKGYLCPKCSPKHKQFGLQPKRGKRNCHYYTPNGDGTYNSLCGHRKNEPKHPKGHPITQGWQKHTLHRCLKCHNKLQQRR